MRLGTAGISLAETSVCWGAPRMNKRLVKSKDKKLFGVAGGLAEYFDVDPLLMRVLIVVLTLLVGVTLVGYILLAIWMPKPTEDDADS